MRCSDMNKKAYYLTLDAFIAVIILMSGFFLIKSTYMTVPLSSAVEYTSDDILDLMSSAKASEFGINTGNMENTILDAIGENYSKDGELGIDQIIQDIIIANKVVSENFDFSFYINGSNVYGDEAGSNETELLVAARRIVFGYYEDEAYNIIFWGPYEVEVRTWKK